MKKIIFAVLLVLVFDSFLVSAADENNLCEGLRIKLSLDDVLFLGKTYASLFRIDNLDHVSGITDYINLSVIYNISGPDFFK